MLAPRNLGPLFDPASVAVVGASATPGKWGNILAQTVLGGEHRRRVWLVNRGGGEILGRPAVASLAQLPEPVELVLVVVPEVGFETVVDAALAAGARAVAAIVAGLGETGAGARERERAVVERVRAAGAVLLGPNCMGVIDTASELSAAAHLTLPAGEIALVTQSGGLGLDLGLRATRAGTGFSRFVSLGNQADLTAADVVADLAHHEGTRAIACYLEDVGDGRALAAAALEAREAGRHVILLAPGRSGAIDRTTSSHTGSLASDGASIDALCAAAGMTRVHTPGELFDAALALTRPRLPCGRRLGIVSDGGGAAVVGAALAEAAGFDVPPLSDRLAGSLAAVGGSLATVGNPLDLLADDPDAMAGAVELIAGSGEVDAILLTGALGYNAARDYPPELGDRSELERAEVAAATRIGAAADARGFTLTAATISAPSPVVDELARFGVPMYREGESAVGALARLAEAAEHPPRGVPALPPPQTPLAAAGYRETRELLAAAGVPFPDCRFCATASEALAAAREIGFPVALKALGLLHKSDAGGVVLGIASAAELDAAYADLQRRLEPELVSVDRMAEPAGGVELIAGTRWDARLGPVLLVGFGGVLTEVMRDVRTALAPADPATAVELLEGLRGAELLRGVRGRPPVDVWAAAELATTVSRVAAAHPELAELEVNPVLAGPGGALALDARAVVAP